MIKASTTDSRDTVASLLDESYSSRISNLQESIALATKSLHISRTINNPSLIARSLNLLSLYAMIKGEYESSIEMSNEAMKLSETGNDEKGIADAKYNLATVYYKTDDFHLGLTNLIECIAIYKKLNSYHNLSKANKGLGTIYEYFGDIKKAVKAYEEAIITAQKAGDANLESNVYNNLSGLYIKKNNIEKATELIEQAISIKRQTGDLRGLAFSLYGRGKVNLHTGNYEQAEIDFYSAINLHLEMGEQIGLGMAYHKLGNLYLKMGYLGKAKEVLHQGVDFSNKNNVAMVKYKCYHRFYQIYKLENDPVNALKYLELYYQVKEAVVDKQTLKVIENYDLVTQMDANEKKAELQKAEITKKKDIAEQAARIKQDFLSTMSHEIRTPLNAVITIASLLERKENKEEQQLVETLQFSARNLLLIINDFLDFTKLDAGKATLDLRPIDIKNLLKNTRNIYDGLAREKGVNLDLHIDSAVASHYELDETKLSQIIGNLITNAIKFTEYGKVEIKISKIKCDSTADQLLFEITDTGTGIEAHHLKNIFESFYQPQTITTRKQGGTGLGLAIVKKLVALLGGLIEVKSVVGEGSKFYFSLLLNRSGSPVVKTSKDTGKLSGKTVLLAEDNAINAMLTRKVLSNFKMHTELATNGLEAVEKSNLKVFDFILMDIHMPEMDGFEATKNIRYQNNPNRHTPIFALTADVTAENNEEYVLWFNGFLNKPIEINKIYEAFYNLL